MLDTLQTFFVDHLAAVIIAGFLIAVAIFLGATFSLWRRFRTPSMSDLPSARASYRQQTTA